MKPDFDKIGYHFYEYLRLGNRYGDLDRLHHLLKNEGLPLTKSQKRVIMKDEKGYLHSHFTFQEKSKT